MKRTRDRVVCVSLGRRGPLAWKRDGGAIHDVVYVGANIRTEAKFYPVGTVYLDVLTILEQRRLKLV